MPTASKEKVDAIVFRRMWEERNVRKEPWDPNCTLKPDMTKTLKTHKVKQYYHTGVWEKSKFDDEDWCWSCCQSMKKEGGGCNIKIYDPERMNVVSFN